MAILPNGTVPTNIASRIQHDESSPEADHLVAAQDLHGNGMSESCGVQFTPHQIEEFYEPVGCLLELTSQQIRDSCEPSLLKGAPPSPFLSPCATATIDEIADHHHHHHRRR